MRLPQTMGDRPAAPQAALAARYSIEVEGDRRLRISLAGLFGVAEVDAFARALRAARARLGGGGYDVLLDLREMNIQPQPVVEAFAAVIGSPLARGRTLICVASTSLVRGQIRRAAAGRPVVMCSSVAEAAAAIDGTAAG